MKKNSLMCGALILCSVLAAGFVTPVFAEETASEQEQPKVNGATVFRFYNDQTGDHVLSIDPDEVHILMNIGSPWHAEGVGFYTPVSGPNVFRLCNPNSGEHFYTESAKEAEALKAAGWRDEGVAFYSAAADKSPVYRLFNPNAGNKNSHHFTLSENEVNTLVRLGWKNEGIAWYATTYLDPYVGSC